MSTRTKLKNNCVQPEKAIMIVLFQAQHTLGRRIVEKQPMIRIFEIEYPSKAKIEVVNTFSCHAGQADLISFATVVSSSAEKILLVHGEERGMETLQETLGARGIEQVEIPTFGKRLTL